MKNVLAFSVLAMMTATMVSCMSVNFGNGSVDKTPTQVTRINQVTTMNPFDNVEIGGSFKVIYEQGGGDCSVRIEASEQALREMTVYVKDNALRIRQAVKKPTVSFKDVKIYVTSPALERIEIAGSGVFAASNPITAQNMRAEIAGSGNILLAGLTTRDIDMEIAGSGDIEIGQLKTDGVRAEIAGSGDISMGAMTCKKLSIEIAGSGSVNCEQIDADEVHTEIAGSGDVNLKGTVRQSTKDVAGSGKVNIN